LIGSRVRNYKRMNQRRVVFSFGVVYQTPADKLQAIPQMVRDIIESIDQTRFDRAHFQKYGDSALDFEVVYYVENRDYNLYMDIQQKINLAICRQFEKENIEFAYPTQTLYVRREVGDAD
jgi:small-conductance mechanosensitive channel